MWLWVLRILFTAAMIYCHTRYYRLVMRARRQHKLSHAKDEDLPWDMTDKLLTDEGKELASEGRMWGVPAFALTIVCVVLWFSIR